MIVLRLKWVVRLLKDILLFGLVNRSPGLALIIYFFLLFGLIIFSAQISAPFIYTLF